jgi:hypothetical protein
VETAVDIRWTPSPIFIPGRLRGNQPLNRKLQQVMLAMATDAHNRGGNPPWKASARAEKCGGVTGTLSGRLRHGWKAVAGQPRITNETPYARDFYLGHNRRLAYVPAHTRKTRRGAVKVRGHYRMEAAQVARPINWTRPWADKALDALKDHYELR